ncbi:hypothetical protein [Aquimarina sp. 2304DJ70-9]|uniref:hypothetical protein n=1 Tax=Aquimarina penaris TaxID=3231044 RepID=UPI003461DB4D
MYKKNKLKLAVPFFLICSLFTYCQDNKTEKQDFVKSFFEDVFINDKPLELISNKYRYKGSKIKSKDEANEMFKQYITYLRTEKKHLLKKDTRFKVENYNNSSMKDLWLFERKERKNIFIVSVDNKIESYILLNNSKIISLLYFRKGSDDPAYFIPYYVKQEQ